MAEKKIEKSEAKNPPLPASPPKVPGTVRIETSNGIYTIKKPTGRLGAKHFALLTKSIPAGRDEQGNVMLSPGDQERFGQVFEEWCAYLLPHLVVAGPFKYEDMPGEDQYAIFLAMFEIMNMGDESGEIFRVLE